MTPRASRFARARRTRRTARGFDVAVLGSGTAIPHARRGASGYACIAPSGEVLLVECGPGSTRVWPRFGITFDRVIGIAVTHHHVDHCSDIAAVLFGRAVSEPSVTSPLVLAGPKGHGRVVAALGAAYGEPVLDRVGAVTVRDLGDGDSLSVGPFHVTARVVAHSQGALALRVEHGRHVLVFSGDTGPSDALVELARGSDLALFECSYPASRAATKHLNTRTAAEAAVRAGVKRLVLTHFYAACDAVDVRAEVRRAGYRGKLTLARDGASYRV